MKTSFPTLIAALVLSGALTSCSYNQFGAIASGSSLGGMFGSSIGGLMGGPRGSDKGTLAGMVIGGVAGAVVTSQQNKKSTPDTPPVDDDMTYRPSQRRANHNEPVEYGTYSSPTYPRSSARTELEYIEVTGIKFLDANNNHCLDPNESAFVQMDIYNRGDKTLYNVAPQINCSNNKVLISSAAIIEKITPGNGVRYKAAVRAPRRLRDKELTFSVNFGTGRQAVQAKTFRIRCSE